MPDWTPRALTTQERDEIKAIASNPEFISAPADQRATRLRGSSFLREAPDQVLTQILSTMPGQSPAAAPTPARKRVKMRLEDFEPMDSPAPAVTPAPPTLGSRISAFLEPVKNAVFGSSIGSLGGSSVAQEYDRALNAAVDTDKFMQSPGVTASGKVVNTIFGAGTSGKIERDLAMPAALLRKAARLPAEFVDFATSPAGAATVLSGGLTAPIRAGIHALWGTDMAVNAVEPIRRAKANPTPQNVADATGAIAMAVAPVLHGKPPQVARRIVEKTAEKVMGPLPATPPPPAVKPVTPTPEAMIATLRLEADPNKAAEMRASIQDMGGEYARALRQAELEAAFKPKPAPVPEIGGKPVVPETGISEAEARAEQAKIDIAKNLGVDWETASPSDRAAIEELVAQGHVGTVGEMPAYQKKKGAGTPPPPAAAAARRPPTVIQPAKPISPRAIARAEKPAPAPVKPAEGEAAPPLPKPTTEAAQAAGMVAVNPPEQPGVVEKPKPAIQRDMGELQPVAGEPSAVEAAASESGEPVVEAAKPAYPTGNTATVITPRGTEAEVQYAVVEADSPIASHDLAGNENPAYPSERQPRDRTRVASQAQIEAIAQGLNPIRLASDYKATDGAPITDENLVVEAGNGRMNGIRQAYAKYPEKAKAYREFLVKEAKNLGLDPAAVEGMKQPVLVRIRRSTLDPAKFGAEANEQWTASMSDAEQARSDAQLMSPNTLGLFIPSESGDIIHTGNRDFVRAFVNEVIGPNERSQYQQADGSISQAGVRRIQNAIFARAYGDTGALEKLSESTESNIKNITTGMLGAAPKFVNMQEGIRSGTLHPVDITGDISAAVNKLSSLRERGTPLEDYLNQISMFDDGVTPEAREVLNVFNKYSRAPKKIGRILESYVDGVEEAGNPQQQGMFGNMEPPTKGELLEAAVKRTEKEFADEQGSKRKQPVPAKVPQEPAGNGPAPAGASGEPQASAPSGKIVIDAQHDLFGDEGGNAAAEATAKAKLEADRLAAEFNSPITAGNRRTKLKPGAKPQQENMFEGPTEPPPQAGFDFQLEREGKALPKKFSEPMNDADIDGSITNMQHRYYPPRGRTPGRIYVDQTGKALLSEAYNLITGRESTVRGLALDGDAAQAIAMIFKKPVNVFNGLEAAAFDRIRALGSAISDALEKNPDGFIMASSDGAMFRVKGTIRHEAAHMDQRAVEGMQSHTRPMVSPAAYDQIPNFDKASKQLVRDGYNKNDPDSLIRETLSVAAGNVYDKKTGRNDLGLTHSQMADTVRAIVKHAIELHGDKAEMLMRNMPESLKAAVAGK